VNVQKGGEVKETTRVGRHNSRELPFLNEGYWEKTLAEGCGATERKRKKTIRDLRLLED